MCVTPRWHPGLTNVEWEETRSAQVKPSTCNIIRGDKFKWKTEKLVEKYCEQNTQGIIEYFNNYENENFCL